jgi:hypothetical protein
MANVLMMYQRVLPLLLVLAQCNAPTVRVRVRKQLVPVRTVVLPQDHTVVRMATVLFILLEVLVTHAHRQSFVTQALLCAWMAPVWQRQHSVNRWLLVLQVKPEQDLLAVRRMRMEHQVLAAVVPLQAVFYAQVASVFQAWRAVGLQLVVSQQIHALA